MSHINGIKKCKTIAGKTVASKEFPDQEQDDGPVGQLDYVLKIQAQAFI